MKPQWAIRLTAETPLARREVLQIAAEAGKSAFSVYGQSPMATVLGSGFVVPEGLVTAKHVIAPLLVPGTGDTVPGASIRVRGLADRVYRDTRVQHVARDYDVAVLAAPPGVETLAWADSDRMTVGTEVIVLAAPDTLEESFIAYASAGRIVATSTVVPDLFRYTVPVQPGSSGGPVLVFNERGKAIGINLLQKRYGGAVMGVGLKANTVRAVLAGDVPRPIRPTLLPEGVTGTDMLILGGSISAALFILWAVFRA